MPSHTVIFQCFEEAEPLTSLNIGSRSISLCAGNGLTRIPPEVLTIEQYCADFECPSLPGAGESSQPFDLNLEEATGLAGGAISVLLVAVLFRLILRQFNL